MDVKQVAIAVAAGMVGGAVATLVLVRFNIRLAPVSEGSK